MDTEAVEGSTVEEVDAIEDESQKKKKGSLYNARIVLSRPNR